jgi:thiamine-phosphate pyrophosphorylase
LSSSAIDALWRSARRLGRRRAAGKRLPPLLFFVDPPRTPHPEQVIARLPPGSAIIFRTFGAADAAVRGAALAKAARRRGIVFLVGADVALAVRLRADGVHLPERMTARVGTVRALRRRFLVTAAAHGFPAALRARSCGAHAIVISPVFASASRSAGRPLGTLALASLVRRSKAPVYALGGVNPQTARRLHGSQIVGLAAVSALIKT